MQGNYLPSDMRDFIITLIAYNSLCALRVPIFYLKIFLCVCLYPVLGVPFCVHKISFSVCLSQNFKGVPFFSKLVSKLYLNNEILGKADQTSRLSYCRALWSPIFNIFELSNITYVWAEATQILRKVDMIILYEITLCFPSARKMNLMKPQLKGTNRRQNNTQFIERWEWYIEK